MRSQIACLLVTHQITDEAMPWMKRARDIFGRLVVFVDRQRAFPETEQRAREIASVVYHNEAAAFFDSDFHAIVQACESDWVFYLDHDEELSPEWSDPSWRALLGTDDFTHYLFPRRWVLENRNYIAAEPWWPDLQLRLFRADVPARFPTKPHEPVAVSGNAALVPDLTIYHHIWLLDRAARQEKVKFYDSLRPGGALDYFYQHEQFDPRQLPRPSQKRFDAAPDVVTMPRLDPQNAGSVEINAHDLPDRIAPGKLFWLRAVLRNRSSRTLVSAPLFPVRVSYHWRDAATGAIEIYDGLRSNFITPLPPGQERELEFVVLSPARPGKFLLELTLVQEQNFWFDEVVPGFVKTVPIEVFDPRVASYRGA